MGKKTFLFRNLRRSKDFNNLDAVAVNETWLHDGYFDGEILSSSLYTIFRRYRGGNKRGGGALLAVKTDLLVYRRPDLEPQNSECLLANLRETTCRICIVRDFNVPTINCEYAIDLSNSTDGVKFCNLINSHFLTQVVKEPTRISQSRKTILDLVFYSESVATL